MLTPRQLSDITADVTEVLTNPAATSNERQLARHARYLLDEVAHLSETDKDRREHNQFINMTDEELSKLDQWKVNPNGMNFPDAKDCLHPWGNLARNNNTMTIYCELCDKELQKIR